jgi:hypothetical protein
VRCTPLGLPLFDPFIAMAPMIKVTLIPMSTRIEAGLIFLVSAA